MKRRSVIVLMSMFLVAGVACGSGGKSASKVTTVTPGGSHAPVTLTVWDYFTERELSNLTDVIQQFNAVYPWIHVNLVPGKSFNDYVRGINSGQAIDVAIDAGPDNVAKYCDSGAFIDLASYL